MRSSPARAQRCNFDSAFAQLDAGQLLASYPSWTAPTVSTTTGGRKVGYLRTGERIPGLQDEVIAAFQQVQPQGIQDLVLTCATTPAVSSTRPSRRHR